MDFEEFVKVVKKYIETSAEKAFRYVADQRKETQVALSVDKLTMAFYEVGHRMSPKRLKELKKEASIPEEVCTYDMETFAKLLDLEMHRSMSEWRQTCGFSPADVLHFRKTCDAHHEALTSSSEITEDEWVSLQILPKVLDDLEMGGLLDTKTFLNAFMRAEHSHSGDAPEGEVHFEDVLILFRHLEIRRMASEMKLEQQAIRTKGLDDATVKLFRSKFDEYKDKRKGFGKDRDKITRKQVQLLLVSDCKVVQTQQQRKLLIEAFDAVLGKDTDLLSFRDFLSLLSHLDSTGCF
jgi:hypothetical protein